MKWSHPGGEAWLAREVWQSLVDEVDEHERALDRPDGLPSPFMFVRIQNQFMLLKFFLEQAFGSEQLSARLGRLIAQESGSFDRFRDQALLLAIDPRTHWLSWGLSFAAGRFCFTPMGDSLVLPELAFCTSPMITMCMRPDVIARSGLNRPEFAEMQLRNLNYAVVENRLACLEKPLDVFALAADCQDDQCRV